MRVKLGTCISRVKPKRAEGEEYPILSITMRDGIVRQDEKFKKRIASADTENYIVVPYGKLVQGIHIDEGNFGVQDIVPFGIVSPAYKLWEINESIVYPKYIEMFLRSPRSIDFYKTKLAGTVARRGKMSDEDFLSMDVPLPDIEEQKEIVRILDKVSGLIAMRKKQLQKLDDLVKSRFVEMFGDPVLNTMKWNVQALCDVCDKLTDGTHFSPESYSEGEYRYITAKNIKVSGFDFSNITYVNADVHDEIYARCNPEYGDVLYIKDGVTTGIAMVNTLREPFTMLSSVALLKQNRTVINGMYLCGVLNNRHMYDTIRSDMGGAAITRLTIAKLNKIQIPVPSLDIQNQFAVFVEQTDKSKLTIQQSLDKLELMKKALMQKYFG